HKVADISNVFDIPFIVATKVRDIKTGKIVKVDVEASQFNLKNKNLLIVDDILDGGGTFIPLASQLRSEGARVDLFVTHLIASKGLDILKNTIDNRFFYNIVGKYINRTHVMEFNNAI